MTDRPPVSGEPRTEAKREFVVALLDRLRDRPDEDMAALLDSLLSEWEMRIAWDRPPVSGEPPGLLPVHPRGTHEIEAAGGWVVACGAYSEYGCMPTEVRDYIVAVLNREASTGAALDVAPTIDEKRAVVNLLRESDYYPDQGSDPPAGNDGVVEDDWDRYQSRLGSVGFAIRRARLAEQERRTTADPLDSPHPSGTP